MGMTLLSPFIFVFNIFDMFYNWYETICWKLASLVVWLHNLCVHLKHAFFTVKTKLCHRKSGKAATMYSNYPGKWSRLPSATSLYKKPGKRKQDIESNENISLIYILVAMFMFLYVAGLFSYIAYESSHPYISNERMATENESNQEKLLIDKNEIVRLRKLNHVLSKAAESWLMKEKSNNSEKIEMYNRLNRTKLERNRIMDDHMGLIEQQHHLEIGFNKKLYRIMFLGMLVMISIFYSIKLIIDQLIEDNR